MAGLLLGTVLLVVATRYVVAATARHAGPGAQPFPCKFRTAGELGRPRQTRWPLRRSRAAWVHDVLIVTRGTMFPRVTTLAVRMPEEALRQTCSQEVRGLGSHPLVILLRLDDGCLVEVAAAGSHRTQLVGPFMAAAIPGLPGGPREQPNLGR